MRRHVRMGPEHRSAAGAGEVAKNGRRLLPHSDATLKRPFRNWLSGVQLIEQSLGLFQIGRAQTLGEPAIDWCQKLARLGPPALSWAI
jgi:hypothetical protein